jgi:hypothetical protein
VYKVRIKERYYLTAEQRDCLEGRAARAEIPPWISLTGITRKFFYKFINLFIGKRRRIRHCLATTQPAGTEQTYQKLPERHGGPAGHLL